MNIRNTLILNSSPLVGEVRWGVGALSSAQNLMPTLKPNTIPERRSVATP
jgi:hypothetical protein